MATPFDTPDWVAFAAAVRADPADDIIRLSAADWLDERGEAERAELIRLMIAARTQFKPKQRWHRGVTGRPRGGDARPCS